jgi:hypothetical protein
VSRSDRAPERATGLAPLLFALNFAVGLPPKAMMAPPTPRYPTVRPLPRPIVSPSGLTMILGRPTIEIGRGRITLGEVDTRLGGLTISLDVFRATEGPGALIGLGIVRPDPTRTSGTTIADLWRLSRAAMSQHGVPTAHPGRSGDGAFMAVYGGTAQLAWLAGAGLATVSVTQLHGDPVWILQAARSIAVFADAHVALQGRPDESFTV